MANHARRSPCRRVGPAIRERVLAQSSQCALSDRLAEPRHRVCLRPKDEAARLELLLGLLREKRCLLVLDNFETVLQPGEQDGRYRDGYAGYGRLLQRLGESWHQSCLLLTSREAPPEIGTLVGERAPVRSLEIRGLGVDDGGALLHDKGLAGDAAEWSALVERYGGNTLLLKVVSESIRQVFGGSITAYLEYATASFGAVFSGIRRLLDAQVRRLSELERALLRWLAAEREPVTIAELAADLGQAVGRGAVLESVEALQRRSLVERGAKRATFTLQPVVLEYVTDRLVEEVAEEIAAEQPVLLLVHALVRPRRGTTCGAARNG